MNRLHEIIGKLSELIGISTSNIERILITALVIILFIVIKSLMNRRFDSKIEDVGRRYLAKKSFTYGSALVMVLAVIVIWIGGGRSMLTYLGILSAGVAIALKDPIVNFVGWMFIVLRKPFSVGDRIEINKTAGDVIDVQIFKFSLMEIGNWVDADQSTGRVIHIPNGDVFRHNVANFNQGFRFIWNEIPVTVTFESKWKKARDILKKIINEKCDYEITLAQKQVKRAARKYMIYFKHLTPIIWTKVIDSGVTLTIRYLCDPKKRRISESVIWEAILDEFEKHDDIDFAYPTRRSYNNRLEGKPGARAEFKGYIE